MSNSLPTQNGVYVTQGVNLEDGPLVFVLYGGHWRSSPSGRDARGLAQIWNDKKGLQILTFSDL